MTKKDEKDNPQDDSSEMNEDLDSLSLDEKAAFDKIMAEINQMNQPASPGDNSLEKQNDIKSAIQESEGEKDQGMDESEPANNQDLSDEQQDALDKIMAEINAKENGKQAATEPDQEKTPQTDEHEEKLSDEQQAALDKIMAEINAKESGKQAATEPVQEKAPQTDEHEEKLSDEQQAALDKIMAEINAKESGKQAATEPVQEKTPQTDEHEEKLSDEQQAALDKIMTEINARESGKQIEAESGDKVPPPGHGEIKEEPVKETQKLSLDEFDEELAGLLAAPKTETKRPSQRTVPSQEKVVVPDSGIENTSPALEPKSPPLKFSPAPQPSITPSGGAESVQIEHTEVQNSPSAPVQQDYALLQEIDTTQIEKISEKQKANRRGFWVSTFGKVIKTAAAALVLAGAAGAAYQGYGLYIQKNHQIEGIGNQSITESLPFDSSREEISTGLQLPSTALSKQSERPGQVAQQSSSTSFSSLKADIIAAREQINTKMEEIRDLKVYYQKGIQEEQLKIRSELQAKPARSLETALTNSPIELSMRAIQRRLVYIAKLDTPLKRLEASSEDLLFLERRTQLFETLSQWISGPSIPEYKLEVANHIESHFKVINELKVDDIIVDPPAFASIWSDLITGMNKEENAVAERSKKNAQDQQISLEICKGEYGRKYLLTTLSAETAQCLIRWSGKDLYLNTLTELSPQVAKILIQWPGEWLSLNNVKEISVETAKYLSQWPGKRLSLNGLEKLSPQATAQLSRWKGEQLEMIGLTAIGRWENYATRLYLSESLRRKLQMQ